MTALDKIGCVVLVLTCLRLSQGILISENGKLNEEDKRGSSLPDTKNAIVTAKEEPSARGKTAKRGIIQSGGSGPSGYGGYDREPGRYGGPGERYPHTGVGYGYDYEPGKYGGSGSGYPHTGHLGDDRVPPIYEPHEEYHHSGGGYLGGRPSGHGFDYGPSYDLPHRPVYHGGYDGDDHHQEHNGGDHGISLKTLTLKKILLPLAGLAILGVAAAAAQNPILLQLGTVSGRRKRSLPPPDMYPPNPFVKSSKIN